MTSRRSSASPQSRWVIQCPVGTSILRLCPRAILGRFTRGYLTLNLGTQLSPSRSIYNTAMEGRPTNNRIHRLEPCLTALRILARSKDLRRDILIERTIDEYLKADPFSLAHALERLRRAIHYEELARREGGDWSVAKNYVRLLLHRHVKPSFDALHSEHASLWEDGFHVLDNRCCGPGIRGSLGEFRALLSGGRHRSASQSTLADRRSRNPHRRLVKDATVPRFE
jgi:hypothetical protein